MRLPENKLPIDPRLAAFIEGMDEEGIILLTLKILNPEKPLHELAKDVWGDLGAASRRRYVHKTNVSRVIEYISRHPYQLAVLLNSKLMPLAIATLYAGMSAKKENVRVTAAKEIIRLAQTTVHRMSTEEEEAEGTSALDQLFGNTIEGEFHAIDGAGDATMEVEGEEDNGASESSEVVQDS